MGLFGSTTPPTPPGNPLPGVGLGKFGANPPGTVEAFTFTPNGTKYGFTNHASSVGFPWTTGRIIVSNWGGIFTITGSSNRTPAGAGTIQLVSGSLSQRMLSGPNANRGWVRLELTPIPFTPSMSPAGLAAAAGLMLLAVGYAVRRGSSR